MKKIIALMLSIVMVLGLVACGTSEKAANKTDLEYVKEKGVLVVGITDFAPMDFKEGDEFDGMFKFEKVMRKSK